MQDIRSRGHAGVANEGMQDADECAQVERIRPRSVLAGVCRALRGASVRKRGAKACTGRRRDEMHETTGVMSVMCAAVVRSRLQVHGESVRRCGRRICGGRRKEEGREETTQERLMIERRSQIFRHWRW